MTIRNSSTMMTCDSADTTNSHRSSSPSHSTSGSSTNGTENLLFGGARGTSTDDIPMHDTRTLFVGNLSFFCEEKDLYALLTQYAHIEFMRILFNRRLNKSLMYGFVTVGSETEADEVVHLLDGHLFMGRKLKIALAKDRTRASATEDQANTNGHISTASSKNNQVHVSFSSNFLNGQVVFPTEMFLRKIFQPFGRIDDVAIKAYHNHENQSHQEGHGVLVMENASDAMSIIQRFSNRVHIQGFQISCAVPNAAQQSSAAKTMRVNSNHHNQRHVKGNYHVGKQNHHHQVPMLPFASNGHVAVMIPVQASSYSPPYSPPYSPRDVPIQQRSAYDRVMVPPPPPPPMQHPPQHSSSTSSGGGYYHMPHMIPGMMPVPMPTMGFFPPMNAPWPYTMPYPSFASLPAAAAAAATIATNHAHTMVNPYNCYFN